MFIFLRIAIGQLGVTEKISLWSILPLTALLNVWKALGLMILIER